MSGTKNRSGGDRVSRGQDTLQTRGELKKPDGMTPEGAAKWDELVAQFDPRLLRSTDAHQLYLLSELLAQGERITKQIQADPTDMRLTRALVSVASQVYRLSAVFGLSPQDRARIKIPESMEESPLQQMLAKRGISLN
jgi:hypothetical protein